MSHGPLSRARHRARPYLMSAVVLSSMGALSPALAAHSPASVASPVTIDYVLPTVANNSGANGTSWRTKVWIYNHDSRPAAIRGYFGQSIPDLQDRTAWLTLVPSGRTVSFEDEAIGITGPGMVSFDVDETSVSDVRHIVIRSETYNDAGLDGDGTPKRYGLGTVAQKVPQAYSPSGTLLRADEEALAPLPISPGPPSVANASRVNAVFVSTTSGGTISVVLRAADGTVARDVDGAECRRTVSLPPFTWHQENDLFSWMNATPTPHAYLSVRPSMSDAFVAAIHVENSTGDGALFPGTSERMLGTQFVFPVAHAGGANGTIWRTDVSIINPGPVPDVRALRMDYTPRGDLSPHLSSFHVVPALGSVAFPDAMLSLYPGWMDPDRSAAGSVYGWFWDGPSVVTTLTYNVSPAGRFGVGIPAWSVEASFGGAERVPAVVAGIEESASTRTNLTLQNTGPGSVTIAMTGIDEDGRWLGTGTFVLSRHEERQFPSVLLETFGLGPPASNTTILLEAAPPTGEWDGAGFIGYATLVNNSTGDGTYVPAQALPVQLPEGPAEICNPSAGSSPGSYLDLATRKPAQIGPAFRR